MNRNITATILLVLALGIYFTMTSKMLDGAKEVSKINAQYLSALNSAEQLISIREKIRNDYNNLSQENREKLAKIVPNSVDNIRLIIDLNGVAVKHGLVLKNVKAAANKSTVGSGRGSSQEPVLSLGPQNDTLSVAVPILDSVNVSFDVSAPYQQFISLLQDLEANLRIMDVTHLTVNANDSGMYDYHVELKTYWLRSE